jgi:hypothetical protein
MSWIQALHKIISQCGNDIKRQTRQEYMHWSITICRNKILLANNNNNNNNVDNKLIIIWPKLPPPYLHIDNSISTSMLDNFQNISSYCNYAQNSTFTYIHSVFNIDSKAWYQLLLFGYTSYLLSSQQVVFNLSYYRFDVLHRCVPISKPSKHSRYYNWSIAHVFYQ